MSYQVFGYLLSSFSCASTNWQPRIERSAPVLCIILVSKNSTANAVQKLFKLGGEPVPDEGTYGGTHDALQL